MRVAVVGGGPAGLYFSLLFKKVFADGEIVVIERNPADATYGWGVVFSDRTLTSFREADLPTYERITDRFIIWDAIDVCYREQVVRCGGQAFSGISRRFLLGLLQDRCAELGVRLDFEREVDDVEELRDYDLVVGADGVRSIVRAAYEERFKPRIGLGSSRYIWFGTTRAFDSFTFVFRDNDDGFFQAHAYPFDGSMSTFIVECDDETWRRAGLDVADETASIAYCESLFEPELRGHPLISNNSKWINFVNLKNSSWHHENVVLVGDAAHTAHFSIGSGTKLAMEDSIALANALRTTGDVGSALIEYELERKPRVLRFQEAARQSQTYFENTRLYRHMDPLQFSFHLLSRSGRIDYDDLRLRDRHFVGSVDRWFAARSPGQDRPVSVATPPAFSPMTVGGLELDNRIAVVSSSAGSPTGNACTDLMDAASSGAGLVMTAPVAVSTDGRITPSCAGLYDDAHVEPWQDALTAARVGSAAKIAVTLGHAGPRGATRPRALATDVPLAADEGWKLVAASPLAYTSRSTMPRELDVQEMDGVIEDYVAAARRAQAAEFDMIEIHMGHGYLLGSFLSPLTNRRHDDFGGCLDDRLRFPLEVLVAIRDALPREVPVGVALNASDWASGGTTLGDAVDTAKKLKEAGCAAVRVVAGQTVARFRPRYDPYYLLHYADRIRNEARMAVIATGDISTVDEVNTAVAAGRADACLLRSNG
jgi:anthraniloyl-CoA monooxygenase